MTRSLETRLRRLEGVAGVAGITEKEFEDAMALLHRHARVGASKILYETAGCEWSDPEIDPAEAKLMMIAEETGQIEAAEEIKRRYWRARGIDIDEKERREVEESMRRLGETFPEAAEDAEYQELMADLASGNWPKRKRDRLMEAGDDGLR